MQYHNAIPVEIFPGRAGSQQGLIARSRSVYDGSCFVLTDSVQYKYPTTTGPESGPGPAFSEQITCRTPLSGNGSRDRRRLQTFDGDNRVKSFIQQRWDTAHARWVDLCRQTFMYRNGLLTCDSAWNMNEKTGKWSPAGYHKYLRDDFGRVDRVPSWNWDEQGRLYLANDLHYLFNAAGNMEECSAHVPFKTLNRRVVTYSAGGIATGLFNESWDTASHVWRKAYGYVFVLGSGNNRSAQLNLQWNKARAGWDTLSAYTYEYNTIGQLRSMSYCTGAPGTPSSRVVDMFEYAYDSDGRRISAVQKTPAKLSGAAPGYETGAEKILFYYQASTTSMGDKASGTALKVWPVPASDRLHFDVSLLQGGAYKVLVTDLQGRSLSSFNRKAGDTGIDQISLNGMAAGNYNLSVQTTTGKMYTARFVVAE